MRRDSLESIVNQKPILKPLLHACSQCKRIGIKPGILETHYGDYGARDFAKRKYEEMNLNPDGRCDDCAEEF